MFSRVSVSASLARPSVAVAAAAGGVAEAATRTLATANINFTEPPAASAKPETKVRVGELENGVRVAAIEGGPSSTVGTVGVFVGSGSRDETTATSGAAHFNKALAYRATEDNTYFLAIRTLEATGAQVSTTSSREATIYTADVLKPHTPTVLSVMADTILNAKVQLYEIEDARAVVGHETHQAMTHGPTFVSERLHATAYGSANLGLPAFCPPEQVNRLARDDLVAFRNGAHVANNIVVAGVGIDFDDLANVAGGVFGGAEGTKQARSKASYTGGSSYTSAPGVTHLAVGFESVASTAGADLFALGVLQNHVARAVSAAVAGIDGAHGATAGLSAYTDSGLFGVSAAGEAAAMGAVADALVGVLQATKKNLSAADLTQAQNNATADYLMAVEARGTRFEDLGAQVLAGGAFLSPSAVVKGISEVTAASVAKVAKQVLASVPTVVAHGDHSHVPSYANISAQLK